MKYVYPACFYQEDECVVVEFPDLGCATQGKNLEEAMYMAADCAAGWILTSLENGEKLPKPSEVKRVNPENENGFVSLVYIDLDLFIADYDEKPVKKTLTIPSWLNRAAEKSSINFSATLKEALIQKIDGLRE